MNKITGLLFLIANIFFASMYAEKIFSGHILNQFAWFAFIFYVMAVFFILASFIMNKE